MVASSSSRRRAVVAASSSPHRRCASSLLPCRHKCLHTGIHKSQPLSPPESSPRGPHHQSGRRVVVSSVPVSVITAILTNRNPPHRPSPHSLALTTMCTAGRRAVVSSVPAILTSILTAILTPQVLVGVLSCHAVPAHPHRNLTVVAQSCHPLSSPLYSPPSSPALITSAGRRVPSTST